MFGPGSSETAAAGEWAAAAAAGATTGVADAMNGEAGVTTVTVEGGLGGVVVVESTERVEIVDSSES